eukprot:4719686-Alexandrium_andersonii.AAC.1
MTRRLQRDWPGRAFTPPLSARSLRRWTSTRILQSRGRGPQRATSSRPDFRKDIEAKLEATAHFEAKKDVDVVGRWASLQKQEIIPAR